MGRTVLIVDDHRGFRASARLLLEAEGFLVVGEAADAAEALRAAEDLLPDLVLVDVNLPDLDGFAVAAALRERVGGPLIVLTSSRDDAGYAELATATGARGFLPKAELCGPALEALIG